jgi:hypothetical protein
MQYPWLRTVRGIPLVSALLLSLIGCGDGGSWTDSTQLRSQIPVLIAGSVGDGPIVNADIVVYDARGRVVVTGQSDDEANYFVMVPAGTRFPLRVAATGGIDLVSGDPADFEFNAVLLDVADSYVNVSPMTTLVSRGAACRPGGVNDKNVAALWDAVYSQIAMGFDRTLMDEPMRGSITAENAPAVVYANEGLGESIRRTHHALQTTDVSASMDQIVSRLACDLADGVLDGKGRKAADPRTAATFIAATGGVQLEVMAHQLFVNGQDAMSALNASLATILPESSGLQVQHVPITQDFINQALATLMVLQSARDDEILGRYIELLQNATPATVTGLLRDAFGSADRQKFVALIEAVALADSADIDEQLSAAEAGGEDGLPIVSFASSAAEVAPEDSVWLSWSTADAVRCQGRGGDGGWNGRKELNGSYRTGPLHQTTTFELSCSNANGTVAKFVTVAVKGFELSEPLDPGDDDDPVSPTDDDPVSPTDDEDPTEQPLETESTAASVKLTASPSAVDLNGTSTLSWTSEGVSSCTASGGWSGDQPTSGSATVGPITRDTTFSLSCSGDGGSTMTMTSVSVRAAALSWEPPDSNVDGSALTDLGGYRIHYGTGSRAYTSKITIDDPNQHSFVLALPTGTYYFAMTAFDADGEESAYSNEVSKRID